MKGKLISDREPHVLKVLLKEWSKEGDSRNSKISHNRLKNN
jgi:hypothetical protein